MTSTAINAFHDIEINRIDIPQHFLDLKERVRTNLFPWRGQFSPGLVSLLLSTYSVADSVVFDPFAGVGTTLFESARENLPCHGTEVNPAAVAMAETVMFVGMKTAERRNTLSRAFSVLEKKFPSNTGPLFGERGQCAGLPTRLSELIIDRAPDDPIRNILTNILIRVCELEVPTERDVYRAFNQHSEIIEGLPHSAQRYSISNSDARKTPTLDNSVSLVITSPPYINVFNYHQNNRRAMELLGWDLLHVAKSEFGSNRKHRQNRFLTVIQYCLDMEEALLELRRVVRDDGRVIFVVGRESCIRGIAFQNGSLVGTLAGHCGFTVGLRQERKFKSRFGELIYEDIIHLHSKPRPKVFESTAREIAVDVLSSKTNSSSNPEIRGELRDAIEQAPNVKPSPLYH